MLVKMFSTVYIDDNGSHKTLTMPVQDGHVPLRPWLDVLGILPSRAYSSLRDKPHRMLQIQGYNSVQVFCMTPDGIDDWLATLSQSRYRKKELVSTLQTVVLPTLRGFMYDNGEQPQAETEPPPPLTQYEEYKPDYLTEEEARKRLGFDKPIYIDKPLNREQRARLFLNQMGMTACESLEFMVKIMNMIVLYKLPDDEDSEEPYKDYIFDIANIGILPRFRPEYLRAAGWDVATVFFRKYPERYDFRTHTRLEFSEDRKSTVMGTHGYRFFPWFHPKYHAVILGYLRERAERERKESEEATQALRWQIRKSFEASLHPEIERRT